MIGAMKRLPNALVSGVSLVGAMAMSVGVGCSVAIGVVITWWVGVIGFNNDWGDANGWFLIIWISTGIFVSLVTFTALASSHHVPAWKTVPFSASAWFLAAVYLTWHNWCIHADSRVIWLNFVIRMWLAICIAGALGLLVSRTLLKKAAQKRVE
jgi:high-affinity Fe2+/Pb2+ permease